MKYIFPPAFPFSASQSTASPVKFFLPLDGLLANFTSHAASYLDDLKLPFPKDGIFEERILRSHFVPEVIFDVCNGIEFWESVPMYPWSWLLFERAFKLSRENVYFVSWAFKEDMGSWGGKAAWTYKNFGTYGIEHLILTPLTENITMLCSGPRDILICTLKESIELWNAAGGHCLHFPEIDVRFAGTAAMVADRLLAMNEIVKMLDAKT